ncbi:MAG: NAD(P)H-dependent oxidoreductase [Aeromonas veronii]
MSMRTTENKFGAELLIKSLNFRFACKLFDIDKKIEDDKFNVILESARLAPSSFGMEPWQILVVQNKELRAALAPHCWGANGLYTRTKGQLGTASHFVVFLAHTDKNLAHHALLSKGLLCKSEEVLEIETENVIFAFKNFQENDFFENSRRRITDWSGKQAYIALSNMMTAAAMMGIDSCPIEGFDRLKVDLTLRDLCGVNIDSYSSSVMLALGYRISPQQKKVRRDLEYIVKWCV